MSTRADQLYEGGTALLAAGKYEQACDALNESLSIDPAPGTALALARCYEKWGKLARAWSAYQDAEARARRAGQTAREVAAREQAELLAPRLPKVSIQVGKELAASPGFAIDLDGKTIGAAAVGTPIPIDPGDHAVEIRADGKIPLRRAFSAKEGEATVVSALDLAPVGGATPAPTTAPPSEEDDGASPWMTTGFVVGGVGVAMLGVGTVLGILASGANSDYDEACRGFRAGTGGDAAAFAACSEARDKTVTLADTSTVMFVAGGVLAAAGVTLVVVAGAGESDRAHLELTPGVASLTAHGAF